MSEDKRQILENIKLGISVDSLVFWNINLVDLLNVDEDNITYFEYACKNHINFSMYSLSLVHEITNNLQALYICAKYNNLAWLNIIDNEDIFFENVDVNKNLLDYIFENNVEINPSFFAGFKKRFEIIDYIIKYKRDGCFNLSSELLEILLKENYDGYLIDKYIDIPEIRKVLVKKAPTDLLINYGVIKKDYDILRNGNEDLLLSKMDNGKRVIDELFDKGMTPTFYGYDFKSKEIVDTLIKRNRVDLLYNADLSLLLSEYDNGITYLDLMIKKQKEGEDVHFEQMSYRYFSYPAEMTAIELIKLAENNFQGFVPLITKDMLLYKGKSDKRSILECLIDIDRELTVSKIIPCCGQKYDPNFVIILKNLGIESERINFEIKSSRSIEDKIESWNKNYAKDCVSICPELLLELKELFYNDGQSNKDVIDTLITSYEYLTSSYNPNNEMFMLEVKQLIEIKKNNYNDFVFHKIDNEAYFKKENGICLDNNIIGTINHEITHALHYYLTDNFIPDVYFEMIENVRNNDSIIDKVKEYSDRIDELKRNLKDIVSQDTIKDYYEKLYQGDKLLSLAFFLSSSKAEQKELLKDDYHEQVLDTILASTYTTDEFIKQRIEIEEWELVDAMLRDNYDALIAIGDILDAIFLGKFKNGALLDQNGANIKPTYGHGIPYYNKFLDNGFREMIANYGSIIKSKNSDVILKYLRSIIGNDIVDMMKEVYEEKIIKSEVYLKGIKREGVGYGK